MFTKIGPSRFSENVSTVAAVLLIMLHLNSIYYIVIIVIIRLVVKKRIDSEKTIVYASAYVFNTKPYLQQESYGACQ